jgi:hypothetical protein
LLEVVEKAKLFPFENKDLTGQEMDSCSLTLLIAT